MILCGGKINRVEKGTSLNARYFDIIYIRRKEAVMLFSTFRSAKRLKSLSTGKVFQYLFENIVVVVYSTDIDNAAMVKLFCSTLV
ncbi:unnamed protein product [Trifolium pratense]|uniref:Uncharacterized protein n=1 Tax=Trifolium pratense TaxID=57577 RepID=A0ACB0IXN2_TRIPR|nr:unnamed protein product [Trifolium pratense]